MYLFGFQENKLRSGALRYTKINTISTQDREVTWALDDNKMKKIYNKVYSNYHLWATKNL